MALHFANVCCLQESKLDEISMSTWREIGGYRINNFHFLPARGSAGEIILGCNSQLNSGCLANVGAFSISFDFCSILSGLCWRCTAVYGPNVRARKGEFWDELRGCAPTLGTPWVLCGDFNAIFALEDKASGIPNFEDLRQANAFLQDLGLREPPSVGRRFTWTNGQEEPIWVRLDRFIVNSDWAD